MNRYKFLVAFLLISFLPNKILPQATYEWKDYFEPVPGKIVGIWPTWSRWETVDKLKELKYKFGFDYLLLYPGVPYSYDNAINAGYTNNKIMFKIGYDEHTNWELVYNYQPIFAYYFDEPLYHGVPFVTYRDLCQTLHNFSPSTLNIFGEWDAYDQLDEFAAVADKIMCSGFDNNTLWVDPDQRSLWTSFRNVFGTKFNMTWIGAHKDESDYGELCGHASNIGLTGIWLFQTLESNDANSNIYNFCTAAWNAGYLLKKYQMLHNEYINGVLIKKQNWGPLWSTGNMNDWYTANTTTDYTINSVTVTNNRIDDYYSNKSIVANTFVVPSSKHATLNAEQNIWLKPGFHAQSGSKFAAYIKQGLSGQSYVFANITSTVSKPAAFEKAAEKEIVENVPTEFELNQNYPNPFNPSTTISFSLPKESYVSLKIYNILGQEVADLINDYLTAGVKKVVWDGRDLSGSLAPSGTYIYRVIADDGKFVKAKKMILMK
jgi:hypothetical protein